LTKYLFAHTTEVRSLVASIRFAAFLTAKHKESTMKSTLALLSVAFLFNSAPALAEDNPPSNVGKAIERPVFYPGEWWQLKIEGGPTPRRTIKEVGSGRIIIRVTGNGAPFDLGFTDEMNMTNGYATRSGAPMSYSPHSRFLAFPMQVGTKWGGNVTWTTSIDSGDDRIEAEAVGWEKIILAGKEYDTMRIEYRSATYGNSTCWYAPAVKYRVKCTGKPVSYEVTDFSVR
jgi:hypothetical protein